jgi:hypothetical protein
MIGKKNIVFGFFYLALTASLGPYMIVKLYPEIAASEDVKQERLGALQQAQASNYEIDLTKMSAEQIATASADAVLALSARLSAEESVEAVKSGPHAHGNLEALLNIAVGILLAFLAVPVIFKQVISWAFIAGTLLHSGMLFLAAALQLPFAAKLLASPLAPAGPFLILLGLLLAGIATVKGYQTALVKDDGGKKKKTSRPKASKV